MSDAEAARLANVASYATRNPLHGSPHLNHRSVWAIYERMAKRALASVGPRPRVLDLGAGEGSASRVWLEAGARLTAVDSSAALLKLLKEKHPDVIVAESDAIAFLEQQSQQFDIVSHVSMLHHIPDYLSLLEASSNAVAPGGCLLTFQDPLRYDRVPRSHHLVDQALYIPWRLTQGNVTRGIGNRIRRARGRYLVDNQDDQEEYHVQRNGMDSDEMVGLLRKKFASVHIEVYFSSQARVSQWIGERMRIRSKFGILATGRL
jgi:SAM-dependent methyltransferase